MTKINIIQFLPYFPPHKGGLETHAQERGFWREKKGYGDVINVVFDIGYFSKKDLNEKLILIPAVEIIPTFPIPKFRKKEFRKTLRVIARSLATWQSNGKVIVVTRTRFFTSSLLGGIFAKRNKIKRVHIEHGVDYVKLNSKLKELIARTYDQIIGRWVFRNSDQIIGISQACKNFANKFTKKEIPVIYRGIEFNPKPRNKHNGDDIRLGFVGRLVELKGVDLLIKAFAEIYKNNKSLSLQIVGDGEEKDNLEKLTKNLKIDRVVSFLGFKDRKYLGESFLSSIDILVNPSYQEGLPTSVLEGLLAQCVVVATDVGGTKEISNEKDLILSKKGEVEDLKNKLECSIKSHNKYIGLSYKYVRDNFSWDKSIEKYQKVLNLK
ncbi:MAG TPA: glycosyltransferase family 4 protein [Candidatus Absconditabacterales bacterium]|nr:glycosyltransferase family 4 protein [Candidatus Absconditabacterales bacterium]